MTDKPDTVPAHTARSTDYGYENTVDTLKRVAQESEQSTQRKGGAEIN